MDSNTPHLMLMYPARVSGKLTSATHLQCLQGPVAADHFALRELPAASVDFHVQSLREVGHRRVPVRPVVRVAQTDHIRRKFRRVRHFLGHKASVNPEGEIDGVIDAPILVHLEGKCSVGRMKIENMGVADDGWEHVGIAQGNPQQDNAQCLQFGGVLVREGQTARTADDDLRLKLPDNRFNLVEFDKIEQLTASYP